MSRVYISQRAYANAVKETVTNQLTALNDDEFRDKLCEEKILSDKAIKSFTELKDFTEQAMDFFATFNCLTQQKALEEKTNKIDYSLIADEKDNQRDDLDQHLSVHWNTYSDIVKMSLMINSLIMIEVSSWVNYGRLVSRCFVLQGMKYSARMQTCLNILRKLDAQFQQYLENDKITLQQKLLQVNTLIQFINGSILSLLKPFQKNSNVFNNAGAKKSRDSAVDAAVQQYLSVLTGGCIDAVKDYLDRFKRYEEQVSAKMREEKSAEIKHNEDISGENKNDQSNISGYMQGFDSKYNEICALIDRGDFLEKKHEIEEKLDVLDGWTTLSIAAIDSDLQKCKKAWLSQPVASIQAKFDDALDFSHLNDEKSAGNSFALLEEVKKNISAEKYAADFFAILDDFDNGVCQAYRQALGFAIIDKEKWLLQVAYWKWDTYKAAGVVRFLAKTFKGAPLFKADLLTYVESLQNEFQPFRDQCAEVDGQVTKNKNRLREQLQFVKTRQRQEPDRRDQLRRLAEIKKAFLQLQGVVQLYQSELSPSVRPQANRTCFFVRVFRYIVSLFSCCRWRARVADSAINFNAINVAFSVFAAAINQFESKLNSKKYSDTDTQNFNLKLANFNQAGSDFIGMFPGRRSKEQNVIERCFNGFALLQQ